MLARHAFLLIPVESVHPRPLQFGLARPEERRVTPLSATLMGFPSSVANKGLTATVSPLAATLTKNRGAHP